MSRVSKTLRIVPVSRKERQMMYERQINLSMIESQRNLSQLERLLPPERSALKFLDETSTKITVVDDEEESPKSPDYETIRNARGDHNESSDEDDYFYMNSRHCNIETPPTPKTPTPPSTIPPPPPPPADERTLSIESVDTEPIEENMDDDNDGNKPPDNDRVPTLLIELSQTSPDDTTTRDIQLGKRSRNTIDEEIEEEEEEEEIDLCYEPIIIRILSFNAKKGRVLLSDLDLAPCKKYRLVSRTTKLDNPKLSGMECPKCDWQPLDKYDTEQNTKRELRIHYVLYHMDAVQLHICECCENGVYWHSDSRNKQYYPKSTYKPPTINSRLWHHVQENDELVYSCDELKALLKRFDPKRLD